MNKALTRRSTLAALAGAGSAALFIPAWNETVEAADTITCVPATPTVTEGPYWVDEKLFRSDIRTDPTTGVARAGVPLTLTINVENLLGGCSVLSGAYVDIWHCDAKGIYSDESTYNPGGGTGSVNTVGQKFLRGYQITDQNGQVKFTTIYPGWYSGRTIHIHFRVRTYSGSNVVGNFVSQIFFADATNDVVMALPAYARSTARDTTNARDMVYQGASTPERMLATLTGDANSGYQAVITAAASLQAPAATAPAIAAGGIGSAVSGAVGLAPGSWVAIYGTNLATMTKELANSDLVDNTIPTSLAGVTVKINGKAAFVQYVSAGQVNVLAPDDTASGSVPVVVTNSVGTSNTVNSNMQAVLPALSVSAGYVRAVRVSDGALVNGTGAAESGFTTVAAAKPGDVLALYGSGFGPTDPAVAVGPVFTGAYQTANPVTVAIGNVPAQVLWAGLVGPGAYQINVVAPSVASGDQVVVATVASVNSQAGAMLKVAS
jgi:uncharacterized protein (TIGR03437 family)